MLPINFIPEGKLYNKLSSVNNTIVLKTLRKVLRENNITKFIFINFFDPFFLRKLPADLKPERFVYHCMDDLSQVHYTRRHGVQLEEEIIRNADVVLCTSRHLAKIRSSLSPNVYFHPNAADVEMFGRAASNEYIKPAELEPVNRKVIGFMGSIEYRTDFTLLKKIALHHRDKILFLLGPVAGNEHVMEGLDKMPNVMFAGAKDINMLPAYLQYFDCCIIPYKINTLTASIYPLKINEYLAAGKPVVATNFSEDIFTFNSCAYIVQTHEEFIRAIDTAIKEDTELKKQERIKAASANSWEKRVEEFWRLIT